jgi:hypothetical protein
MVTANPFTKAIGATLLLAGTMLGVACEKKVDSLTPEQIQRQYGVAGAYTDDVPTPDGAVRGTLVPVTLADGRKAQLFMPQHSQGESHAVYFMDDQGLHPIHVIEQATRDEITGSPTVVEARPAPRYKQKRSWEKDALIIGGSAGAGTAIGAIAGGGKGAAVGATAGGIGGLIYDLAARNKD